MFRRSAIATCLLAILLIACGQTGAIPSEPGDPDPDQGVLEPYTAKGRVVDTQGRPIAGVQIIVDSTVYYNSGVTGTTDANGEYKLSVPDGSWRAYARMERELNGITYEIDLLADTYDSFAGMDGAVRNFAWSLTGEKPAPLVGYFGGDVIVFGDEFYDQENLELTLTPVGPLVDGSSGQALVKRPNPTSGEDPNTVVDIPLGRYSVSVVYAPVGAVPTPMMVGSPSCDDYAESRTIDFDPNDLDRARICVKSLR